MQSVARIRLYSVESGQLPSYNSLKQMCRNDQNTAFFLNKSGERNNLTA